MPTFIRNPRWHDNWRRALGHSAYVDAILLPMAVDNRTSHFTARTVCIELTRIAGLMALKPGGMSGQQRIPLCCLTRGPVSSLG